MSRQSTPSVTRRDDHNNPVWAIEAPVEVIRMDNSLSLTDHIGVFRNEKGKPIGSVGRAIGGFVFVVNGERGGPILAIDCKVLVETIFANRRAYAKATRMPPKPRPGEKRRRK
jgi:hypothetical protein